MNVITNLIQLPDTIDHIIIYVVDYSNFLYYAIKVYFYLNASITEKKQEYV